MTPQEIAAISPLTSNSSIGKESWSKWAAFALTPFGWSCWPTPHFRCNRLFLLTLYGGSGEETVGRFATLVDFVEREFGEPGEGMKQGWFRTKPAKPGSQPNLFRWVKSWGKVTVLLEPRDGEPMLWIEWKSSDKS